MFLTLVKSHLHEVKYSRIDPKTLTYFKNASELTGSILNNGFLTFWVNEPPFKHRGYGHNAKDMLEKLEQFYYEAGLEKPSMVLREILNHMDLMVPDDEDDNRYIGDEGMEFVRKAESVFYDIPSKYWKDVFGWK